MPKPSLSPAQAPAVIDIEPAAPAVDPWAKARRYVESATLFQRASLAAQIMAGVELAALRKIFPENRGGDRRSAHRDQKPHDVAFDHTWKDAVERQLGISDQTASRWMEMAHEAKKRLAKGDLTLGSILEKHPGALTPAEQELLKSAVHKISDGRTQLEFLLECGVTKAPQGSAAKGGDTRAAAAANAAAREAAAEAPGADDESLSCEPDGWEPRAKHLNNLLLEALLDGWWNDCTEQRRREMHGNLIDAAARITATLKKEPRA